MNQTSQVENDLTDAETAVVKARDLLAAGNLIDLAGLDEGVAKLCDDMAGLPAAQRQTYKFRLVALIDNLNALVDALSAQHSELRTTLKDLSSRQRAASAYGRAPGQGDAPAAKK